MVAFAGMPLRTVAHATGASHPKTSEAGLQGVAERSPRVLSPGVPGSFCPRFHSLPACSGQGTSAPLDSVAADEKSPGRALAYSLGGTVLLAPLFGAGLVAGPAAGHFYAGNHRQAWTGIAIRSGAYLTAGLGVGLVWGSTQPTGFAGDPGRGYDPNPPLGDTAGTAGVVLLSVGLAALIGSGMYDIATAWGAAKKHNRAQAVQARVAPAIGRLGEQVGLSLQFRF